MKRAITGLMLLVSIPAMAQEEATTPATPDPRTAHRPLEWFVKIPTELGFSTSLDNSPGDVTISRIGAEVGVGIPIATMALLDLGFDYEYSRYQFDNATGFIAGVSSPWEDVHRETLRARFSQRQTRQLAWFVGGSLGWSAEEGAELADSVFGSFYGGATYYVSQSLRLGGLLGVQSRIEDDPLVLVVPIIDYELDPQWRLTNAGRPGLSIYYTPQQQWTLSLGAWYDYRDIRLDDNGPVPSGVVRERSVPILFGVTHRPTSNMTIEVGLGVRVGGEFQLDDSAGNEMVEIESNPAPFLSFAVGVKF